MKLARYLGFLRKCQQEEEEEEEELKVPIDLQASPQVKICFNVKYSPAIDDTNSTDPLASLSFGSATFAITAGHLKLSSIVCWNPSMETSA